MFFRFAAYIMNGQMKRNIGYILPGIMAAVLVCGCSSLIKAKRLEKKRPTAEISLPRHENFTPAPGTAQDTLKRDTLRVTNLEGREMIVMHAVRDEEGNMVASQVLNSAKVTARFRNVAERHGKVDVSFRVTVPAELLDSKWQLRYTPTMYILDDSLKLDKVLITGAGYRKRQYRGYQQYERFLARIISDTTLFIRRRELEIFLRRNIPGIYAFRSDSSFVSDEKFLSAFGVSEEDAVKHYTDMLAKRRNQRRISLKDKKFHQYVKSPIMSEGIRLDSVITGADGDCIYDYTQTVRTRARLKKVGIVLDGEIFEQDRSLCEVARSDLLTFYISSLSTLADESEHYITKIVERRAEFHDSYAVRFRAGDWKVVPDLGENGSVISRIRTRLTDLLQNPEFETDSVTIAAGASPEGSAKSNLILSGRRSESIKEFFRSYAERVADSLRREESVVLDYSDGKTSVGRPARREGLRFAAARIGEDWARLDRLVEEDCLMSEEQKQEYARLSEIPDKDLREKKMSGCGWYRHVREELYPQLRRVDFCFHVHRRGMVKDTIHTTMLDTLYMSGVAAIKDRDYKRAIEILRPYNDYNTAVAYCAADYNHSALAILRSCPQDARVHYMMALLSGRLGDEKAAVEHYVQSCRLDRKYIHRGNLDPEIYSLIKKYDLGKLLEENEEF